MGTEGVNPNPELLNTRLEDLAEKSANRNGTTAHYLVANQALKDDLIGFLSAKFDALQEQINGLKLEVTQSRQRELDLRKQIEQIQSEKGAKNVPDKSEIYLVGSSILREVLPTDIENGTVKFIPGGKVKDVKENINSLKFTPKIIITQIGGNDLDSETAAVDDTVSDYSLTLTETKAKFPDSKLVIAGLPPRHNSVEIRTKTKDFNEAMKNWCDANNMDFINNEEMFEFRSGEVDSGSYIMDGPMPGIHLTRPATIRMLENMKKVVPNMISLALESITRVRQDLLPFCHIGMNR